MAGAASFVLWAAVAATQAAPPAPARTTTTTTTSSVARVSMFDIEDNSFLVEEALNQEKGIFQNIFVLTRNRAGEWTGSFTQEWPLGGQRHQFSYTVPFSRISGRGDVGDVFLNYRFQVSNGHHRPPAFAPRVSWSRSAWQVNLPVSQRYFRWYYHGNAGNTWSNGRSTPFVAGSAIFAVDTMLDLMLEVYNEWRPGSSGHDRATIVSPGIRGGWNIGETQVIWGLAVPITRGAVRDHGVLGYLSYELPFSKHR